MTPWSGLPLLAMCEMFSAGHRIQQSFFRIREIDHQHIALAKGFKDAHAQEAHVRHET